MICNDECLCREDTEECPYGDDCECDEECTCQEDTLCCGGGCCKSEDNEVE